MEAKYRKVRAQLDSLGYHQILELDSVLLVDKLVADLVQTTESLKKYKELCRNVLQVRFVSF